MTCSLCIAVCENSILCPDCMNASFMSSSNEELDYIDFLKYLQRRITAGVLTMEGAVSLIHQGEMIEDDDEKPKPKPVPATEEVVVVSDVSDVPIPEPTVEAPEIEHDEHEEYDSSSESPEDI